MNADLLIESPQTNMGWGERYELMTRIAMGGMGEVFIARQLSSGGFEKRVALKLLLPHLSESPEFVQMFLDEARIAARMNHPNIVQIFDFGQMNNRPYLTMALVEGVSLSTLLKMCRDNGAHIPTPIGRLIALGLCEAIEYAHNLRGPSGEDFGTVHRDVNPSNVLLSQTGAVLLTDFGIAKAQGNLHQTRTGQLMGKFAYMAPEQMVSGSTDRRADVYAASLTLYEMFTLVSPFKRDSEPATIEAVRSADLPDPLQHRSDLSLAIAGALVRGLSRDVERRFKAARSLAEALMDGPIARPQELGEFIQTYCSKQLAVFQSAHGIKGREPLVISTTRESIRPTRTSPKSQRKPFYRSWKAYGTVFAAFGALISILAAAHVKHSNASPVATAHEAPQASPPMPLPANAPTATSTVATAALAPAPESEEHLTEPKAPNEAEKIPVLPIAIARTHRSHLARAGGVGYLSADAAPWAVLSVDDREIDETPISRFPVSAGRHRLVFRNPQTGRKVERSVRIQQGKVFTIRVNLTE